MGLLRGASYRAAAVSVASIHKTNLQTLMPAHKLVYHSYNLKSFIALSNNYTDARLQMNIVPWEVVVVLRCRPLVLSFL